MTENDLRSRLRTDLLRDEPAFAMSSRPWLEEGRRSLRRRRRFTALGAGVLTAAATVGALQVADRDETSEELPAVAREVLAQFDPATFPALVDATIRATTGDAIPPTITPRIEPTVDGYVRLRPADYSYTDAWTARYDLSPTDELMVILRFDRSANEGDKDAYCAENLESGDMEECTADTLPDGSVSVMSVFKVRPAHGGFTGVRAEDAPESWWFARQVVDYRGYGYGVIAREYVKARSLEEAEQHWAVDVEGLTRIAASPKLVYEMPHAPKKNCDTTMLMPRNEEDYGRIVCENSLNP
jgi:hypothetical protein